MRLRLFCLALGIAAVPALLLGCATLQEIAALRQVAFSIDRVSDVRIAGVRVEGTRSYGDLGAADVARLVAAAGARAVPLDMILHVRAENPATNEVSARLVALDWKFFIEARQIVDGSLPGEFRLPPGEPVDVPLAMRFDLVDFFGGGARELFDLALALSGQGGRSREIRLEAMPTIQTGIGPIRYPDPIVIRRRVGSQ
ncbi:MAG TPA: hypothetical protein VEY91_13060 [Candidatus Limnocylindria bacterium]|nr:hypothetical protein [Candidatus Limnocylindria bacterium]